MTMMEMAGPAGTAERCTLPDDVPHAGCAGWLLCCPGQSVAWDQYLLAVIHLRDVPGLPPAHRDVGGATHEVQLYALHPGTRAVPDDSSTWVRMDPPNLIWQGHLDDDTQAVALAEMCARAMVAGILWAEPPLSGQQSPWHTTLVMTTAHLRGEPHGGVPYGR